MGRGPRAATSTSPLPSPYAPHNRGGDNCNNIVNNNIVAATRRDNGGGTTTRAGLPAHYSRRWIIGVDRCPPSPPKRMLGDFPSSTEGGGNRSEWAGGGWVLDTGGVHEVHTPPPLKWAPSPPRVGGLRHHSQRVGGSRWLIKRRKNKGGPGSAEFIADPGLDLGGGGRRRPRGCKGRRPPPVMFTGKIPPLEGRRRSGVSSPLPLPTRQR